MWHRTVVTGVLNAIFVYGTAYHVQLWITKLITRYRPWADGTGQHRVDLGVEPARRGHGANVNTTRSGPAIRHSAAAAAAVVVSADCAGDGRTHEKTCLDRFRKHVSDVSTLCTTSGDASDANGPSMAYIGDDRGEGGGQPADALRVLESGTGSTCRGASCSSSRRFLLAAWAWTQQNIFLTSSFLLFLLIGLPLSCLRHNDLCLDVGFLFTVWLTFTSAQTQVKQRMMHQHRSQQHLHHHYSRKRGLTALATLLNPVLWTSLFLICYGLVKSHIRQEPPSRVVADLKTNNTISNLIAHHLDPSRPRHPSLGAGDIATSILNAGIASWGLKLFEYRHQAASRGGLTVALTSSAAALANVVAWPLLARAIGVRPAASDLSFAARSVTIALGGPAMASLGGDAGVNAVGVVVNGILFQLVAGCFPGGFADVLLRWRRRVVRRASADADADKGPAWDPLRLHPAAGGEGAVPGPGDDSPPRGDDDSTGDLARPAAPPRQDAADDVRTVAAGVTIGVGAAAMGTAHLYERNSRAAPYSALSMTTFGVFTVLFTVGSPMTRWLVGVVGGP